MTTASNPASPVSGPVVATGARFTATSLADLADGFGFRAGIAEARRQGVKPTVAKERATEARVWREAEQIVRNTTLEPPAAAEPVAGATWRKRMRARLAELDQRVEDERRGLSDFRAMEAAALALTPAEQAERGELRHLLDAARAYGLGAVARDGED